MVETTSLDLSRAVKQLHATSTEFKPLPSNSDTVVYHSALNHLTE